MRDARPGRRQDDAVCEQQNPFVTMKTLNVIPKETTPSDELIWKATCFLLFSTKSSLSGPDTKACSDEEHLLLKGWIDTWHFHSWYFVKKKYKAGNSIIMWVHWRILDYQELILGDNIFLFIGSILRWRQTLVCGPVLLSDCGIFKARSAFNSQENIHIPSNSLYVYWLFSTRYAFAKCLCSCICYTRIIYLSC